MTSFDRAFWLWRRGFSVIPIPYGGKVPVICWKEYQSRRPTEAELRRWFGSSPTNLATITGAVSGVVVVDTDSSEAEAWAAAHLPPTLWRVSTAKGTHRYYRHPGVHVRNAACIRTADGRLQLDVRGDGGFVIGPGSTHATGHVYNALGDWRASIEELPIFDREWIVSPPPSPRAPRSFTARAADVVTRARAYLAAIPVPVVGQGSDAETFRVACRLVRGFELDEETTVSLLREWAPTFDEWWLRRKVENATAFGSEPVGGYLEAS